MADSQFAIFPDSQLASGTDLKGKSARSKKQALCDVKNTLRAKRATGNEPLRKFGFQVPSNQDNMCKDSLKQQFTVKETPVQVPSKLDNMCKDSLKQQFTFNETPAKCLPVSEGTFKIACDDDENHCWDKCGECTGLDEDFMFQMRPLSEQLTSEDLGYIAQGVFSMGLSKDEVNPEHFQVDAFVDVPSVNYWEDIKGNGIEGIVPPLSPVSLVEPIYLSLSSSDEE